MGHEMINNGKLMNISGCHYFGFQSSSHPGFRFQVAHLNQGCKDEKNTVILTGHASDPVDIRFARRYKVSQA
jgi:hypothetical protein